MNRDPLPSPPPRQVYADSSGLFAFFDADSAFHDHANAVVRALSIRRIPMVMTNFLRAECHALMLNRLGYQQALLFLDRIETGAGIRVVRITADDEQRALIIIRSQADKTFSLVDATSFVVMERLRITHAFSFDSDFRQYGRFVLL